MSDRIRMRIEVRAVLEYDVRPEDYGTDVPEDIAKMDLESAEDDVYMFIDGEDTEWTITVAPVAAQQTGEPR